MRRDWLLGIVAILLWSLGLHPTLLRSAEAAETPRAGGTIVAAVSADPPTLNPALTTDANALFVAVKLFNGLTVMDRIERMAVKGDPAIGVSRPYVCDNIRPAPFVNVERYCNPKVDELFKAGASRVDPKERAKLYFEVQEILARELPTIPLLETGETNILKPTIHGLFQSYSPHERWDEVWLAK